MNTVTIGPGLNQSLYKPTQANSKPQIALIHTTIFIALIGAIYSPFTNEALTPNLINSLIACAFAYSISCYSLYKLSNFPGASTLLNLPSVLLIVIAANAIIFTSFRLEYSRTMLTIGAVLLPIAIALQHKLISNKNKNHLYLVTPFGCYQNILNNKENHYKLLTTPSIEELDVDQVSGIIFNQHEKLPNEWQQLLARAANLEIPIYDISQVYESLNGKSPLEYLPEPTNNSLKPHWLYRGTKRILESLLIITSSPVWLPLVLLFAIAIKLESKGPAFFIQRRVGQGGKEFNMIKLRSMCQDSEANGAQFAGEDDPRITRIGKFIRKVRIDEIPQFINVLKGEMALIGPRPEQQAFVKEFEQKIPLYTYRHVVKPGITGWAQVTHGYADDEDSTKEKLAHDFYYVKNLSLWLDIVVIVKTIKTMVSGFGAR
ncbi:sugar transferase [Bermanella sp. WJH001]|uniref:sugar transferase n=1 Tax=Bermanella sp. WJH001 TaxID=3048005 RepID=UPI0024BD672C|nr:sugar transferase [Bermanella sp. WJH001]MDJ1537326.1 sugar transferase [Bermanella sp. WJH001]